MARAMRVTRRILAALPWRRPKPLPTFAALVMIDGRWRGIVVRQGATWYVDNEMVPTVMAGVWCRSVSDEEVTGIVSTYAEATR